LRIYFLHCIIKCNKRRSKYSFTNEFKTQIVQLYLNSKRKCEITREYDLSNSVLNTWINQLENTGSFKKENNIDPLEKELRKLGHRDSIEL